MMIETILSTRMYAFQIIVILIIAVIIPNSRFAKWKPKEVFAIWLLLCLSMELLGLRYLAFNPLWICPAEYCEYVSAEGKHRLIVYNSGIHSKQIPVIPICIFVKQTDDDSIEAITYYSTFGVSETGSGGDNLLGGGSYHFR